MEKTVRRGRDHRMKGGRAKKKKEFATEDAGWCGRMQGLDELTGSQRKSGERKPKNSIVRKHGGGP